MGSNPQIPLADSNEDGYLCDGIGVEVVELHAIVVRERPHEPVRRKAEVALVKRHEAHDVAVAGPRLRLTERSDPFRPIGVGDRAEKAIVDERLQHLHGHIGQIPRVRLDDNNVAGHECGGRLDYSGESPSLSLFLSLSLSLSLSLALLPSSPRRSLFLATDRQRRIRREGASPVSYLCRVRTKRTGDEIGEVFLEFGHD